MSQRALSLPPKPFHSSLSKRTPPKGAWSGKPGAGTLRNPEYGIS
jgi:hypothetical protein